MRGSFISVLAVVAFALSPAFAAADDATARAKAALELAKAKQAAAKEKAKQSQPEELKQPREVPAKKADQLNEAKDKAKATGSAMFVSTCEACVETCAEIRKIGPVVHMPKEKASDPFFRVQVWDGVDSWYYHDWNRMPTTEEAAAKSKELQSWVKKPPQIKDAANPLRISLPVSAADCVGNT